MRLFTIIFSAAMAIGTLTAQSTTDRITARFPSPVQVNGTTIPAGEVSIQVLRGSSDSVILTVRSAHGESANVLVNRVDNVGEEGMPTVLLTRTGNSLHFRGVSLTDASGFTVFPTAE